jgi:hypothetical protein
MFSFAGDALPGTLLARGVTPGDVYPDGDFYPALADAGVAAHVALPGEVAATTPAGMLLGQATVHPFSDAAEGVAAVGKALGVVDRGYGFVYLPHVDSAMHHLGPDHPDVETLIDDALSMLGETLGRGTIPEGTLVLLTSDHGMAARCALSQPISSPTEVMSSSSPRASNTGSAPEANSLPIARDVAESAMDAARRNSAPQ